MKILIIGGGGREHALAWKTAQSSRVAAVFVAPGNAGTALEPKCSNIAIAADDIDGLLKFVRDNSVDFTIVGPEAPLVLGVSDAFSAAGLRCFGPSKAAAELEGSKAYCKDFLARHEIPTAAYRTFTEIEPAVAYIRTRGAPIVVKADGLAAGKGVIVAGSEAEAIAAVESMLQDNAFGAAGSRVVIEECLSGEEASFIVMVDGEHILPLASSQDHKARDDNDSGPNTGGMGAYSPAPVITPEMHDRIMHEVIVPTVRGMAAEGRTYRGFLYAGLMIAADGVPRVLEYNCRFGDPETQPIMLRLRSDFVELCQAALDARLHQVAVQWEQRAAVGVVMAAGGYPGSYRKGDVISGLNNVEKRAETCKVFHAGTVQHNGQVLTNGGRVLCVTALGETVQSAQQTAYQQVAGIAWPGVYYRRDIAYRAIAREQENI